MDAVKREQVQEQVRGFISSCPWRWSKSMPLIPHEYIVRAKTLADAPFVEFVKAIREYGIMESWGRYRFEYLYLDGYKYWTMGNPIEETTIINRQKLFKVYDQIADKYDSLFESQEYIVENAKIAGLIDYQGENVIDIGCGTGLLLDLIQVAPENYIGIDPSKLMTDKLLQKHPSFRVLVKPFEEMKIRTARENIYAISTFGSISYVMGEYLPKLNEYKRLFLMFYKPDYHPATYDKAGVEFVHFSRSKSVLGMLFPSAQVYEFNNYLIVQK